MLNVKGPSRHWDIMSLELRREAWAVGRNLEDISKWNSKS